MKKNSPRPNLLQCSSLKRTRHKSSRTSQASSSSRRKPSSGRSWKRLTVSYSYKPQNCSSSVTLKSRQRNCRELSHSLSQSRSLWESNSLPQNPWTCWSTSSLQEPRNSQKNCKKSRKKSSSRTRSSPDSTRSTRNWQKRTTGRLCSCIHRSTPSTVRTSKYQRKWTRKC